VDFRKWYIFLFEDTNVALKASTFTQAAKVLKNGIKNEERALNNE